MNLIKTSFYTSLSTSVTFVTGFVVTKVVAVRIGPQGMAYYGQYQNTIAILTMLGTAAISTGIIKYLSEYKDDSIKMQKVINTSVVLVISCSFIISLFTMIGSSYLSKAAFKTTDFWIVYFLFGLFTTTVSLNAIFLAMLNGLKLIKHLTFINICTSLTGIILIVTLSYYFDLIGVLISSSILSGIIFIVNVFLLKKTGIQWWPNFKTWDKQILKLLMNFSAMAVVSGFLLPFAQILVRDKIIVALSVEQAGYWQAVMKISDYYLAFVTTVLSVYYMPRLSELKQNKAVRTEIFNGYKLILPIVAVMSFLIWLSRDLIIHLIFTPSFLPMRQLFAFQLLGDFFKIGSWLLAYLMMAKALTKTFIVTETIFASCYVLLAYFFINHFGLIGATYAFAVNYALYWVLIFVVTRKYFS
ncbi:MAG: O-antigen translocase [Ginsengibacter sp.]